jgi:hypothetical protein
LLTGRVKVQEIFGWALFLVAFFSPVIFFGVLRLVVKLRRGEADKQTVTFSVPTGETRTFINGQLLVDGRVVKERHMTTDLRPRKMLVEITSRDDHCHGCSLIGVSDTERGLCCRLFKKDLDDKHSRLPECKASEVKPITDWDVKMGKFQFGFAEVDGKGVKTIECLEDGEIWISGSKERK